MSHIFPCGPAQTEWWSDAEASSSRRRSVIDCYSAGAFRQTRVSACGNAKTSTLCWWFAATERDQQVFPNADYGRTHHVGDRNGCRYGIPCSGCRRDCDRPPGRATGWVGRSR